MCKKVLINYQDRWGSGPSYSIEWAKGLIQNGCEVYAVLSQDVLNINEWKYYLGEKNIYFVQTHEKNNKYDLIKKTIRLYLFERKKIIDNDSYYTQVGNVFIPITNYDKAYENSNDVLKIVGVMRGKTTNHLSYYYQYF